MTADGHDPTLMQLAIIQASPFCNIRCSYCYLPDRGNSEVISLETLDRIASELAASRHVRDELTIVWHAGEPLSLGVDFYREAFRVLRDRDWGDVRLSFSMQTNAMMVNDRWCEFFRENDVRVGVSLDGPAFLHDQHRLDRAGRGTFARVMRGVKMLQAAGLDPPIIAVVTEDSLRHAREFWQFFADLGVTSVGLNPEESEGSHIGSSLFIRGSEEEYRRFLDEILDMGIGRHGYPHLREYDNFVKLLGARKADDVQAHDNVPMAIVNFDYRGNFSTFSPELLTAHHESYGNFLFGNILTDRLDDIVKDARFSAVNASVQDGVAQCKAECGYYRFCGGGSPSNKISETGSFAVSETQSCRLRVKVPVSAFLDFLQQHSSGVSSHVRVEA